MHAHGIKILDGAKTMITLSARSELPHAQQSFQPREDLRSDFMHREDPGRGPNFQHLFAVIGNTAATAAQRE